MDGAQNDRLTDLERKVREAVALHGQGKLDNGGLAEAYNNLGFAFLQLESLESALANYDKAVQLAPQAFVAQGNRAAVLHKLGRFEEALDVQKQAILLQPDAPVLHNNLAALLNDMGRIDEAVAAYAHAVRLKPDYHHAAFYCGRCLLLEGRYEQGFELYERRKLLKEEQAGVRGYPQPDWLGAEDIRGKTILVHWEQGDGDTFQFARYIPILEQRTGARVIFATQRRLRHLLRSVSPSAGYASVDDANLKFDVHAPLMSLPRALGTTLATVPNKVPYLSVERPLVELWRRRIGPQGFKIGICWQGSTAKIDIGRSFPLALFRNLSMIPGVRLLSLQKGAGEAQLAKLPAGMRLETFGPHFDTGPDSFLDTAAILECCDLVITSDTGVAHLAGALARPIWVALKFVPDWRWLMGREDYPWYPTMRLFRQTKPDDWQGVFGRIEHELKTLLSKREAATASAAPSPLVATPRVPVSWGELLDKMTILEIKSARLTEPMARANVARELAAITREVEGTLAGNAGLQQLKAKLRAVNEALWQVEDDIRAKEAAKTYDKAFIELARKVYLHNDERGALKRAINALLGSELVEEKSYSKY